MEVDVSSSARNVVLFAVLDRLLEHCPRLEDRAFDVLFEHLSRNDPASEASFLSSERQYAVAWIGRAASLWGSSQPPARLPLNLLAFVTDVTGRVCADEETFSSLSFNSVFEALLGVSVGLVRDPLASRRVKLSYVGALSTILGHTSGLQWTISTKYWSEVVVLAARSEDQEVFARCCKYIADLVEGTKSVNRMFCARILKSLVAQLGNRTACGSAAVLRVLHGTLEVIWRMRVPPDSLFYINDELDTWQSSLGRLLVGGADADYSFAVNKTRLLLAFFKLYRLMLSSDADEYRTKVLEPGRTILGTIVETGTSGDYRHLYDLCNLSYSYWCSIRELDVAEYSADNVRIIFENQIFLFQTMPVYYVETTKMGFKGDFWELVDDLRDDYFNRFMKGLHPLTYRYLSSWVGYLAANVTYDMAIASIRSINVSKELYDAEHLGSAARCFIYLLEDLVTWCVEYSRAAVEEVPEEYVVALLEKNAEMCDKFGLTWRENVEIIKVTGIVFDVLNVSAWSARVVIKSLELLNVAVSNYMSPGMALLIDNARDSDIGRFGPMLFPKLRSENDDVRIAALGVVKTTATLAREKFVSYRKVILDADFPCTVLKMALDDASTSVRASALACLGEMVKVDEFCADLLDEKVYARLLDSIRHPDAPDVVAATCAFLTAVYSHDPHMLPDASLDSALQCLAVAASGASPSRRARLEALAFWRALVDARLALRGWIDGAFPSVTFSRQSKKIVSLDAAGVGRILAEVLDELDSLGCLAVFAEAVSGDDREVALAAVALLGDFARLLNAHEVKGGAGGGSSTGAFLEMVRDLDGAATRGRGEEEGIYDVIGQILGSEAARGGATVEPEEEPTYMLLE